MGRVSDSSTVQELNETAPALITLKSIFKLFRQGDVETRVLENINLEIGQGEYVALMGPSGSGKSTLLNIMSGLDSPTSGSVVIGGTPISDLDEAELARWRSVNMGFVFQQYNLLPALTAFENVELPLLLVDLGRSERRQRVEAALSIVGLGHRIRHYPRQLSGGEEQRVSIARAIVANPPILICDEPTGNLDEKSSREVLNLFDFLNRKVGKTILMVTHDPHAAERARDRRRLEKGRLMPRETL